MPRVFSRGHSAPDGSVSFQSPGRRRLRRAGSCLILVTLAGCAAVTPAPRFSAVSPDDANAPESAVPPAQPILTAGGELAEQTPEAPRPDDAPERPAMEHGATADPHAGHRQPGRAPESSEEARYSCPTHVRVSAKAPGTCPICGMTLVRQAAKPEEPKP